MATRLDAATSASGTSLSYSISAGSNRLLVVMVQQENDGGSTPTCTYGGQSPISTPSGDMDVQINPGTTSQRVTVFFFDEAAIAAAGSTTISVGNVGGGDQTVHAASYQDAAQQVPTNTNSDSSTTSSPNPLTGTDVTTSGDDSVIGAASGQGNTGDCTWTGTTEQTQQAAASSNGSYSDVEVSSASTAVQPRCTWTSPNRQVVVSFEIEHGTSEGITDLDTSYGTAANELDFDDTDVDINGANFEASQGSGAIYLSDASTLAGGSNEVDISSAVNTWADIVVNLDFSQQIGRAHV